MTEMGPEPIYINEDQLKALYIERGFSIERTARCLRVGAMTVWKRLKLAGIPIRTNIKHKEEAKSKIRKAMRGRQLSEEHRSNLSKMAKKRGIPREVIEKAAAARRGRPATYKARLNLLKQAHRMRDDKEYCRGIIKKTLKSLIRKPTKPELAFAGMCLRHNLPYRYVGNGEVMIGTKNPDFINVNGKKEIVEIFGRVFHDPDQSFISRMPYRQTKEGTMEHYETYGFKCIIIWDDELRDESLVLARLGYK